jgi:hypothetical protein
MEVSFDDHTVAGGASDDAQRTVALTKVIMTLILAFCDPNFFVSWQLIPKEVLASI